MVNIPPIKMGGFGMVNIALVFPYQLDILHHLCQDWWNWHRPMDRLDIHSNWRSARWPRLSHVRGQRDDGLLVIPRVEKLRTNKFIAFTHLCCHKFLKSSHSHEDHEDYITFCIYVSGKVFSWFLQHPLPNIHHRHAGLEAPAQALTWHDLITNRVFWYLK